MDDAEIDGLQDIGGSPNDIPIFDGAEYLGEKPKSEKTLGKIVDMLKILHENQAQILKEDKELDKIAREKIKDLSTAIEMVILQF